MLTVFGDKRSGNCLKVKWLLDVLGHDYRWVETDVMSGATRSTDFLTLNPAGQVPAVVLEDGRVLAQSNAIIGFFGEGTRFAPPADSWERAKMYEWLFWEQYSHEPYIAVARFQRAFLGKAAEEIEPRLMERGRAALARLEAALTWRLSPTPGWRTRAALTWSLMSLSGHGSDGWRRRSGSARATASFPGAVP